VKSRIKGKGRVGFRHSAFGSRETERYKVKYKEFSAWGGGHGVRRTAEKEGEKLKRGEGGRKVLRTED